MSAAEKNGYITRPSKASVAFAEERAWISFYNRIADSAAAEEVIQYLDANPDEKHQHPALYLRAKESVRRNEQRLRRAQRIGSFVQSVVGVVVIGPASFVADVLRAGRQIGLECLPEATDQTAVREPATRRLRKLKKQMPIAEKLNEFSQQERNGGITSNEHGTTFE